MQFASRDLTRSQFAELCKWDRRTIKSEYARCDLPLWPQLSGEYRGELLSQDGKWAQRITARAFSIYGNWIGKAFVAGEACIGSGYNIFSNRSNGAFVRKLNMNICVGPSELDGRNCVQIDYRRQNWGMIRLLRGEFRELEPGILLGLGFFGPSIGGYRRLRRIIPFIMWGPFESTELLATTESSVFNSMNHAA